VKSRRLAVAVLFAASVAGRTSAAGSPPWLQAAPQDRAEAALRELLARSSFAGPSASADPLLELAAQHPGTTASGLAQLAAGLLLLERGRPVDALAPLQHADVRRTALLDHALFGVARALEGTADARAARAYVEAAGANPQGAVVCPALFRGAEAFVKAADTAGAVKTLEKALQACAGQEARTLLRLGEIHERRGDPRSAALAYDRLDREFSAAPQAATAGARLRTLKAHLPAQSDADAAMRDLRRAMALFEAGRTKDAIPLLRALQGRRSLGDQLDLVRVRLGRALLDVGRARETKEGLALLSSLGAGSPFGAEAAFHLARYTVRKHKGVAPYEEVATRFPGTLWGEEALLNLANHHQKDARDGDAAPYWRRLMEGYPEGRYVDRATWRAAWWDYRSGRYEQAAQTLERAVRTRAAGSFTPGFLYWAGRARSQLGQHDHARRILEETVRRYKNAYHGIRAREALAQLPPSSAQPPPVLAPAGPAEVELPAAALERVRQLLLIDRLDEVESELEGMPRTRRVMATEAWIEWRRGRLRPAIVAMKRAYPEWVGEAGDRLPAEVWRILYPLEFGDILREKASDEGLDPALVAALVCQESTFDAGAVSRAGARGLMQVIPSTGRSLARILGVKYRKQALHDPAMSLDFGTRYLRQMVDRFDGRVERALAAYNAGPHRVDAWTSARPEIAAEEFIESIPFTETRHYVMTVLTNQVHYRRLYTLGSGAGASSGGAPGR
jgi:soluble lytic murein transglycosylase